MSVQTGIDLAVAKILDDADLALPQKDKALEGIKKTLAPNPTEAAAIGHEFFIHQREEGA